MKGSAARPDRGTFPSKGSQPTKRVTVWGGAFCTFTTEARRLGEINHWLLISDVESHYFNLVAVTSS